MSKHNSEPVPIIDNLNAPEVFACGIVGVGTVGPNISIALGVRRSRYSRTEVPAPTDAVVSRLVMPRTGVKDMITFLTRFLEQTQAPDGDDQPSVARVLQ